MSVAQVDGIKKVRLNSARVGHMFDDQGRFCGEFSQAAGDEVEMTAAEAKRHIERGLASPVSDKQKNRFKTSPIKGKSYETAHD